MRRSKTHKKIMPIKDFDFKRNMNVSRIKIFSETIKDTTWENVLSCNDTTESFNEFLKIFSTAYEKSFPLTQKKIGKYIDKNKSPWMTNSVKKKNLLNKKYLNRPTSKNENNYKQYKNKLNHVIKIAKKILRKTTNKIQM